MHGRRSEDDRHRQHAGDVPPRIALVGLVTGLASSSVSHVRRIYQARAVTREARPDGPSDSLRWRLAG